MGPYKNCTSPADFQKIRVLRPSPLRGDGRKTPSPRLVWSGGPRVGREGPVASVGSSAFRRRRRLRLHLIAAPIRRRFRLCRCLRRHGILRQCRRSLHRHRRHPPPPFIAVFIRCHPRLGVRRRHRHRHCGPPRRCRPPHRRRQCPRRLSCSAAASTIAFPSVGRRGLLSFPLSQLGIKIPGSWVPSYGPNRLGSLKTRPPSSGPVQAGSSLLDPNPTAP